MADSLDGVSTGIRAYDVQGSVLQRSFNLPRSTGADCPKLSLQVNNFGVTCTGDFLRVRRLTACPVA
jgi:hypothetical protein